MKAISIQQPYAHWIALGIKRIENRTWATRHRGLLAIHAGKSLARLTAQDEQLYPNMTFGGIVAVVTLAGCWTLDEIWAGKLSKQFDWVFVHPHTEGPVCWVFGVAICRFAEPIPYRGRQGLFNVPDELLTAVDVGRGSPANK